MATMTTMGLFQQVIGLTHEKGHTLDLGFSMGQVDAGPDVVGLSLTLLSWSDHFLVKFRLPATTTLCRGVGSIKMIHPWRLM